MQTVLKIVHSLQVDRWSCWNDVVRCITERKELVGQLESTRAASDKNEKELQQLRLQADSFANDITVVEKQVEELQMELSASNYAKSKLEDTIEALQSEQQQIVHQCTEMIEDAASLQGLIL